MAEKELDCLKMDSLFRFRYHHQVTKENEAKNQTIHERSNKIILRWFLALLGLTKGQRKETSESYEHNNNKKNKSNVRK